MIYLNLIQKVNLMDLLLPRSVKMYGVLCTPLFKIVSVTGGQLYR